MLENFNKKISILDYGVGNISNLLAAIDYCGATGKIITTYKDIEMSDYIILPGVGAFKYAIEELQNRNMIEAIHSHISKDKPFLGICLGMQLAVVEFARNVSKMAEANSTEFDLLTPYPVVALISEWTANDGSIEKRNLTGHF